MDVKRLYWQFLDIEIWKLLTVRFLLFTEKIPNFDIVR